MPVRLNGDSILLGITTSYLIFAYFVVHVGVPTLIICPWFLLTGIPCPLCGATRAIGHLMHGSLEPGWRTWVAIAWLGFVVGAWAHAARECAYKRPAPARGSGSLDARACL